MFWLSWSEEIEAERLEEQNIFHLVVSHIRMVCNTYSHTEVSSLLALMSHWMWAALTAVKQNFILAEGRRGWNCKYLWGKPEEKQKFGKTISETCL